MLVYDKLQCSLINSTHAMSRAITVLSDNCNLQFSYGSITEKEPTHSTPFHWLGGFSRSALWESSHLWFRGRGDSFFFIGSWGARRSRWSVRARTCWRTAWDRGRPWFPLSHLPSLKRGDSPNYQLIIIITILLCFCKDIASDNWFVLTREWVSWSFPRVSEAALLQLRNFFTYGSI